MAANYCEYHQHSPWHLSNEEDQAAGFLESTVYSKTFCVYFGSLKSWCSGMRLSVCFLSGASMSKVILRAINCNRSSGFLVISSVSCLRVLGGLSFVTLNLMLRL